MASRGPTLDPPLVSGRVLVRRRQAGRLLRRNLGWLSTFHSDGAGERIPSGGHDRLDFRDGVAELPRLPPPDADRDRDSRQHNGQHPPPVSPTHDLSALIPGSLADGDTARNRNSAHDEWRAFQHTLGFGVRPRRIGRSSPNISVFMPHGQPFDGPRTVVVQVGRRGHAAWKNSVSSR